VKPLIYLWPCVTLIFDLLNPKVDGSTPLLRRSSRCQFASKSVHSFSKYHVHKFGNNCCVRTEGWTRIQHLRPSVSLAWRRHNNCHCADKYPVENEQEWSTGVNVNS